ncbi:MAG: ribonuclease H-like domain-containing protein [Chloroflexi bacterium]|nr:ribonuclease H-like domain-containing protein [Chloroflexota bacterium]
MLFNTFHLLPGIGRVREKSLWRHGIITWDDFLYSEKIPGISPFRKAVLNGRLEEASLRLRDKDISYFTGLLPAEDHWRFFREFGDDALFLDIETTGFIDQGYITMIGLYSSRGYRALIRGKDLTPENIVSELEKHKLLVTFYGAGFDLPFIKHEFAGLGIEKLPHLDLCFLGRRLGLRGGLKNIERRLGITRPEEIEGMSGYHAVMLWERYKRGDLSALETLVKYNREDVRNLKIIASHIYNELELSEGPLSLARPS